MAGLYLIFFTVGLLIFAGIVAYSYLQKKQQAMPPKEDYVDPLFAELEEQKGLQGGSLKSNVSTKSMDSSGSVAEEPALEKSPNEPAISVENQKKAPSLEQPSSPQQSQPKAPEYAEPKLSETSSKTSSETAPEKLSQPPGDERQLEEQEKIVQPKIDAESSTVVTELVARIKNPQSIEQQGLLSLFRKHDFKFHRKVHIYGLNELTDMWRDIEFELPAARFTELGVSVQLADREGAMSKKELHDFQQMVLEFTNIYDAPFEFSMDIDEALKQAQALDQIGRRYDSMAVLNVVPRSKSGFRMADIESCARDLMMSMDKNGIFMKTRGQKQHLSVLYRLACTDGSGHFGIESGAMTPVHDLVVYMNVPATEDPELVFQEMVKDANSLATWLEGKVVDRNGRVMTQRSYSTLMQQVSDIAFSMQQDGLSPGDAISKKLF